MLIKDSVGNELVVGDVIIYYSHKLKKLQKVIIKKCSSIQSIQRVELFSKQKKTLCAAIKNYIVVIPLDKIEAEIRSDYGNVKLIWHYLKKFPGYRISNLNNTYKLFYFDEPI